MLKFLKLTLISTLLLIVSCSSNTTIETDISTSTPAHHLGNGRFQNPSGSPTRTATFFDMFKFMSKQMFATLDPTVPDGHVLPEQDQQVQLAIAENPSITWLGHAVFIIRVGGKVIITDPYLDQVAGPWGMGPSRFVDSPIKATELPKADIMLISHNHYDHLDAKTIAAYPWKHQTQVIVPLGLGEFFTKRGYSKVLEQDWWNVWRQDDLTITTLPAVHFSGRGIGDRNRTLWASFSIDSGEEKNWFSGDTARGRIFKHIGERAGHLIMPWSLSVLMSHVKSCRMFM